MAMGKIFVIATEIHITAQKKVGQSILSKTVNFFWQKLQTLSKEYHKK